MRVVWAIAMLGPMVGFLFLVLALTVANGAPQEAALAAVACAFAVIPYCFARALESALRKPGS